jgi:DNA-directed RNA polymerase subunit RPC12/RpoP
MGWYRNHYICERCKKDWADEWSCMCDDDCPHCGARHMSPERSDDLTEIVVPAGDQFLALRSPDSAGHGPDYCELGRFNSEAEAEASFKA